MPILFDDNKKQNVKENVVETGRRLTPLASFVRHPGGVRFETQETEETVELFLRQHPIVNIPWLVLAGVMLVTPSIFLPFILGKLPLPFQVPAPYLFIGTSFWYLATFGFILTNFMHWFFNIYIVTNERIVDIDFYFLLYKHFSQAELSKIQDISFTSSGILQTIFNYGNVDIQTASEMPTLEFTLVPQPERVVEAVRTLIEQREKKTT